MIRRVFRAAGDGKLLRNQRVPHYGFGLIAARARLACVAQALPAG